MKRSKKSKVSWSPGPKLCQVKMFRKEECPANVASQPQRPTSVTSQPQRHNYVKQSSLKPKVPDLPPGFEGNDYADNMNVSNIPRIKWKKPPKFILKDTWLIGSGGESTENRTENFRIAKVMEAVYPHRSAIPSRPSVSPAVEAEQFDDSKTPAIRLIPIEDEVESTKESSDITTNKQGQTKLSCSTQELISGLAPDLSLAASAALTALMKTKEKGSLIDPELLIKFLTDPEIIKNLINDKTGKSSETENQPIIDTKTNPTRLVPQHVTSSVMARNQPPLMKPREQSFVASPPFANPEQRRVSPPKPGNGNISTLDQINGQKPFNTPTPLNPCVTVAKQPSLPARIPSSSLPTNLNLQRPQHAFSEPKVITVKPQSQLTPSSLPTNPNLQRPQHTFSEPKVITVKPQSQLQPSSSAFNSSEMNNVQGSIRFGRVPQTGFDAYPMNFNRVEASNRPRPVVQQPTKSLDYFKNLIKEHGTDTHETNQYHSQNGKFNGRVDSSIKVQKKCVYFSSGKGCKLGEKCLYVHDRFMPNFEAEAPNAKRVKLGRYENYCL